MATRDIKTFHDTVVCDMCGRTLLRGEHAETYLAGGHRREVCDLCADRALHEGWIREDTALESLEPKDRSDRRRSLFGRLRQRRERGGERPPGRRARAGDEEPPYEPYDPYEPSDPALYDDDGLYAPEPEPEDALEPEPELDPGAPGPDAPAGPPRSRPWRRPSRELDEQPAAETSRPDRHVRAVPSGVEQRVAAALELFNASEHTRTVAGVARSLGPPVVSARATGPGGRVTIVVSWELSWYRYEVELGEDGNVHQAAQGYELDELDADERKPTAAADEYGQLHPDRV
jgi:hypothetical protein